MKKNSVGILTISIVASSILVPVMLAQDLKMDENTSSDLNSTNITPLSTVEVTGQRESVGTHVIDRRIIETMPRGNGDIGSMLRILPGVQFDQNQLSNATMGEIAPAETSINGMKYYSNSYLLDGVSFGNFIDPAQGNPNNMSSPSSSSQGISIDTSLLESITVYDSNIPAKYGGFTGGVISAETKKATRNGGKISWEHTQSEWADYKIGGDDTPEDYEVSTSDALQPEFTKDTYRISLEAKPTDNLGVIADIVRKTSTIPLKSYTDGAESLSDSSKKEEKRQTNNFFIKADYDINTNLSADVSINYSPSDDEHFIANAKNSDFHILSGGTTIAAGLEYDGSGYSIKQKLNWNEFESSRDASSSIWKLWRWSSDKNWGRNTGTTATSGEGGYGDIEQKQTNVKYEADITLDPFKTLAISHSIETGVELGYEEQYYNRKDQYEQYTTATALTAGATCIKSDGTYDTELCSTTAANGMVNGQYLKSRIIHFAGQFYVKDKTQGLYLQDEMTWSNWTLRLGGRLDHSELTPDVTYSPRSTLFWDTFGNDKTVFEAGVNRYYSRNFMSYYNQAERFKLQTGSQSRNLTAGVLQDWSTPVPSSTWTYYNFDELDIPYSDEWTVGIKQKVGNTLWKIKYVDRKGRDEVILYYYKDAANQTKRKYSNVGSTDASVLSVSVEPITPITIGKSEITFLLSAEKSDITTSHSDYSDTLNDAGSSPESDEIVMYDGKFIKRIEIPADNYNRPWTAKLNMIMFIPEYHLTFDNLFTYSGGYDMMVSDGTADYNGITVDNYKKHQFHDAVTWDMTVNYELPLSDNQAVYCRVSIDNVLNRVNEIPSGSSGSYVYEKGRQFWTEIGYKF